MGREVSDDIRHVPAPEGAKALLIVNASKTVPNARVARDLPRLDPRVGILRLDDELHTLDGGCAGLGDGAAHSTKGEVKKEVALLRRLLSISSHDAKILGQSARFRATERGEAAVACRNRDVFEKEGKRQDYLGPRKDKKKNTRRNPGTGDIVATSVRYKFLYSWDFLTQWMLVVGPVDALRRTHLNGKSSRACTSENMAVNTAPVKWAQRSDSIYLTLDLPDVKDEQLKLTKEMLSFRRDLQGVCWKT